MDLLTLTGVLSVEANADSEAFRKRLLRSALFVEQVTDAGEQEVAVSLLKDIRGWLSSVEKSRVAIKAEPMAVCKQIDALAKAHCTPLEAEADRVAMLIGKFQAQERERVAAEEKARAKALTDMEQAGVSSTEIETAMRAPLPEAVREPGMVVREIVCYEVTDIAALYKSMPSLVNLEPNRGAIRAIVTKHTSIPGLRVWEETKVGVRQAP